MTVPLVVLALFSVVAGFAATPKDGRSFGDLIRFDRAATLNADWQKAGDLAVAHPEAQGDYRAATALWASAALPDATSPGSAQGQGSSNRDGKPESHAFQLDLGIAIPATAVGLLGIFLAFGVYRLKWVDPARIAGAFGPLYTAAYNKYYVDEFYRWVLDHLYYVLSGAIAWFDRHVVDGLMNGLAWLMQFLGAGFRKAQTGRVQAYAMGMLGGLLALVFLAFKLAGQ